MSPQRNERFQGWQRAVGRRRTWISFFPPSSMTLYPLPSFCSLRTACKMSSLRAGKCRIRAARHARLPVLSRPPAAVGTPALASQGSYSLTCWTLLPRLLLTRMRSSAAVAGCW